MVTYTYLSVACVDAENKCELRLGHFLIIPQPVSNIRDLPGLCPAITSFGVLTCGKQTDESQIHVFYVVRALRS